jgi:hypothetical protein
MLPGVFPVTRKKAEFGGYRKITASRGATELDVRSRWAGSSGNVSDLDIAPETLYFEATGKDVTYRDRSNVVS